MSASVTPVLELPVEESSTISTSTLNYPTYPKYDDHRDVHGYDTDMICLSLSLDQYNMYGQKVRFIMISIVILSYHGHVSENNLHLPNP